MSSTNPPFRLDGKVALVTGSSRGLGRGIAMSLGAAGAKVALNFAHSRDTAEKALAAFSAAGYQGGLFQADVTDEAQVQRLAQEVQQELGAVDILVLNATCEQPLKTIEEYDWDFYQRMLDFFVKSPFLLVRACLPEMKRRQRGRIISVTSEVFHAGAAPFSAYVAAKGGQIGFSRSLARELAPHQITVNMVSPGWIPVERHENDPEEAKQSYLQTIPLGRWGQPQDVGDAVVYLASDEAAFVTGQTIGVNGGTAWS